MQCWSGAQMQGALCLSCRSTGSPRVEWFGWGVTGLLGYWIPSLMTWGPWEVTRKWRNESEIWRLSPTWWPPPTFSDSYVFNFLPSLKGGRKWKTYGDNVGKLGIRLKISDRRVMCFFFLDGYQNAQERVVIVRIGGGEKANHTGCGFLKGIGLWQQGATSTCLYCSGASFVVRRVFQGYNRWGERESWLWDYIRSKVKQTLLFERRSIN